MSTFFVFDFKGGAPGVPVFVNGVIEEYVKKPWNDHVPAAGEHYRDQTPLTLVTKHQKIDLDYCDVHGLFICSEELMRILENAKCNFVSRPLRVLESKKKECTRKKFFLVRMLDRLWAMDEEKSEYRVNRDPASGKIRYRDEHRTYKNVFVLYVDEASAKGLDLFYCEEARRYIVSDRLAPQLVNMKGVRLTRTEQYEFPLVGEKVIDRGD
jgi:hypothetical protein